MLRWNDAAPAAASPSPSPASPDWSSIRRSLRPATWSPTHGRERAETTSTSTFNRSSQVSRLQLTTAPPPTVGQRGRPTVNGSRSCVSLGRERSTSREGRGHRHACVRRARAAVVRAAKSGASTTGPGHGLSWTPDGKHLVFGDRTGSGPASAIYLYSFEDGGRRQLTHPPTNLTDVSPVVSPDGRYLAFVRMNPLAGGGNVFLQKLEQLQVSGEPTQLTNGRSVLTFDWTGDSRSIIHDSVFVEPGLWRIAVAGGAPELVLPNIRAGRPSVARRGVGMVYQNSLIAGDIWELPTPSSPNRQPSGDATFRVIESTSRDFDMRFSPDGTRVAFVSLRSGKSELWVSNRDGSQQTQLTNFDGWRAGSPSWSADGKRIAFDATQTGTGNWNLYIVAADGGPVKPLTSDASNNIRPSWSLDDRWIYFDPIARERRLADLEDPIYRRNSDSGDAWGRLRADRLARWPSHFLREAIADRGHLEHSRRGRPRSPDRPPGQEQHFDVAENGIFMMDPSAKPQATVEMFSFSSRTDCSVARLPPGVRFSQPLTSPSRATGARCCTADSIRG